MKTNWDLTLLYKNENDPQIEKDLTALEKATAAFERKYKKGDLAKMSFADLEKAVLAYEQILALPSGKAYRYFGLRSSLDVSDETAERMQSRVYERVKKATVRTNFFTLRLGQLSKGRQQEILRAKTLAPYKRFFEPIFTSAKYRLTEEAEKVATYLSDAAYTRWGTMQNKVAFDDTVLFEGKSLSIPEAMGMVQDLPRTKRHKLYGLLQEKFAEQGEVVAQSVNGYLSYKKAMDELRGDTHPYSATVRSCDNKESVVESLIASTTKAFSISKSFYKLHAQLLGQDKISMADRAVPLGSVSEKLDFKGALEVTRSAFKKAGDWYVETLDSYLEKGQIDVSPKRGKRGGAFCWGGGKDEPVYVMLNHSENVNATETLAHEMGHAFHSEKIKAQRELYHGYPISTAEVASTFFEQMIVDELSGRLSENDKLVLMHNRLLGTMSTIFRQTAFFNYELELHDTFRAQGGVSNEQIAEIMAKHLKSYIGPAAEISSTDGYFYVPLSTSHTYRFFYIYSYVYGLLISRAMYERWKQDPGYIKQVEKFLESGDSLSPYQLFKSIGLDTRKPEFFTEGLELIKKDVAALRRLAKKLGKI